MEVAPDKEGWGSGHLFETASRSRVVVRFVH
jgi:hypothetical protein